MCAKQSITSRAVILAWLLFLFTASNAFAYDYQVTEIQPLPGYTASRAMGINNLGEVVGRFYNLNPTTGEAINRKAFVWDPTNGAYLLPTLSGECSAWDINDNGFAVGYSYNASAKQRAVLWDLHVNTIDDIGALRNPTTGVYGGSSTAYGINNLDQVVGSADIPNNTNTFTPFHAFLDDTSGISDLGTLNTTMPEWQYGYSIAYCTNNNGQVVGIAQDTPWAGFIYDDADGMRMLPKDPAHGDKEWYAVVINDSGLIGGHVIAGTNKSLPYYWPNESTAPVKITMPAGFPYGEIYGINASGQMVGIMWSSDQAGATEHAFVFDTQNGVRDLNNLIDPASGWVLHFARDINDRGQIAGYGELGSNKRGFTLTLQSNLFCFFNLQGTWQWQSDTWSQLTAANPESMVASGSVLYADFGAGGIYKYDLGVWRQLTATNPESMVASGSVLYADLGTGGIHKYETGVWSQLTAANPESMVVSGSVLYADLGTGGIHKYETGVWSQLTAANPESMVVSGSVLYADLGTGGIHKYETGVWSQLTAANPESMVVSGSVLYADLGTGGIHKYETGVWRQLTAANPESMAVSGSVLYADLGTGGIHKYETGVWRQLTAANPESMMVSGSVLYADLGTGGIHKYDLGVWSQLTAANPVSMAGGL